MGSLVPGRILPLRSIFQKNQSLKYKKRWKTDDLQQLYDCSQLHPYYLGFPFKKASNMKHTAPPPPRCFTTASNGSILQLKTFTLRWRSRRWSLLLLRPPSLQRCPTNWNHSFPPFFLTLRVCERGSKMISRYCSVAIPKNICCVYVYGIYIRLSMIGWTHP